MMSVVFLIFIICILCFGTAKMVFDFSGMTKKHNITMESLNINFIHTMQKIHTQSIGVGLNSDAPNVTYFIPCFPGIYNKLRSNTKLHLFIHEYTVTEELQTEKSRQFLVVSKEQFFFMQLKGWIGTTDRRKAVKAIRYLKEMVSLP